MTKYVKTDYVPEDCDYLTAGKVYEVMWDSGLDNIGAIIRDNGEKILIEFRRCAYLDKRPWTVWEE